MPTIPESSHKESSKGQKQTQEQSTRLFRLKFGSHSEGVGEDQKVWMSKDPLRKKSLGNIVESSLDLAALAPEKFDYYDGPPPKHLSSQREYRQHSSTHPPTSKEYADAELLKPMTVTEAKLRAKQLREKAEALEKAAEEAEKSQKDNEEEEEPSETDEKRQDIAKVGEDEEELDMEDEEEEDEEDGLEELTVEDLRSLAHEERIPLRSNMRKDEMLETIRQRMKEKKGK